MGLTPLTRYHFLTKDLVSVIHCALPRNPLYMGMGTLCNAKKPYTWFGLVWFGLVWLKIGYTQLFALQEKVLARFG